MSFVIPGPLEFGTEYFWRVDVVAADGVMITQGPIWTFSCADYLIVDDFEHYTDDEGNRVHESWLDGEVNLTGAAVSQVAVPESDPAFVHGGRGAMSLSYDNLAFPFYSEARHELPVPEDWTQYGVDTLSLWFRGDTARFQEIEPGVIAMNAAGTDIWNDRDDFRYVYKQLTGDGAITARIDTVLEASVWAKAGVMIRQNLTAGSPHGFMCVTPDGRRAFQNRLDNGSGFCLTAQSYPGAVSTPYWVRLEREGDQFTAYHSPDGVNWILQPDTEDVVSYNSSNPQMIFMPETVYIGLALTSHEGSQVSSAVFSGVEVTGAVTDQWEVADIGRDHPSNCPESLEVTVEDAEGKIPTVTYPDAEAVNASAWTEWRIPLSSLGRIRPNQISSLSLRMGSRRSPVRSGFGRVYIDDIRLIRSEP